MLDFIDVCLTEASNIFELNLKKADVVTEAAKRELTINYGEAELKVMQENGTNDDLAYYYREAENGLVDTIIKAIKKIKDAIIKFFSEMKTKILVLITKKENTEAIEKVEKKVKIFPLLGRKKILVEDYNKEAKIADESLSKLGKLKAKLKGKQEVTTEEVEEVKKGFLEEHGAVIGIGAALTVTVTAAIAAVKHMTSKAKDITNNYQNIATSTCDDCAKIAEQIDNPAVAQKIADATSSVCKSAQESFFRSWKNIMKSIGNAFRSFGKTKGDVDDAARGMGIGESTNGSDTAMSDDEMKKISDSIASAQSSDGDTTEMGEDPSWYTDGYEDDPDDTSDVWDDVMGTSAGLDLDDVLGTDTEGYRSRQESVFDKLLEKVSDCKSGDYGYDSSYSCKKASNEDIISDLFDEISGEVKGGMDYSRQYSTESAFDRLMGEIDDLFN